MNNQMKPCQQPQAHPARCGCEQSDTEQVSSAWLAQLRSEHLQRAEECTLLRADNQALRAELAARDSRDPNEIVSELRKTRLSIDTPNRYKQDLIDCIVGAMAFGFQNANPPPADHWGQQFWDIGRAEGARQKEQAREIERSSADMARIYDLIGLHHSQSVDVLLENFKNMKRFADYLHAVEREFFMVPGEPSEEPEDEGCEPEDDCLVNCWGSSRDQYIEQFRAALARIAQQPGAAPLDDQPYSDPRNGDETFSANGEDWHNYDLLDLLNDRPDLKAGDTVFRAIKHYQDPASFVDHEALISSMNENAGSSDTGEWVDSWPEPGEEAETELTDLLEAWARRHCAPDFHLVRDVTEYTLTAEDLRSHAEGSDHE